MLTPTGRKEISGAACLMSGFTGVRVKGRSVIFRTLLRTRRKRTGPPDSLKGRARLSVGLRSKRHRIRKVGV